MAPTALPTLPRGGDFDIEILREMYPSRGVVISGIDPRLNASRIARRLKISRARVAARLRAWTEFGFLPRYDVWPNPALFGRTGVTFDVRVADRLGKPPLLDRIGLVHGAAGGFELLGDWVGVTFVLPVAEDPGRTAGLLRALAGVAEVTEAVPWASPESGRTLSPLELRIVRVLRQYPSDSLASIARHVGVSTRTIAKRYGELLDDHAVWFVPVFDFRALAEPVVSVSVQFRTPEDRAAFARSLRRVYPQSIEFLRAPFGPVLPDMLGSYFVLGRSAARLEDLEAWVRGSPGVISHEALTMVRVLSYPETFDRLLADEAARRGVR
jgi:DNA-binding Lrp family transcriptional regulator